MAAHLEQAQALTRWISTRQNLTPTRQNLPLILALFENVFGASSP
jgi:hypothetical protein